MAPQPGRLHTMVRFGQDIVNTYRHTPVRRQRHPGTYTASDGWFAASPGARPATTRRGCIFGLALARM